MKSSLASTTWWRVSGAQSHPAHPALPGESVLVGGAEAVGPLTRAAQATCARRVRPPAVAVWSGAVVCRPSPVPVPAIGEWESTGVCVAS